jgi:serine/threonine protein kinase
MVPEEDGREEKRVIDRYTVKHPADPLVGTVIADRYKVERPIGTGGVGTVYRATQLGLGRPVAIKVLRTELYQSDNARARFRREARTAARIQHPNIVTVHDFGTLPDGAAFLVMEYLSGTNLAQWVRQNAPTPVARVVEVLRFVCDAVELLHRSGIVHRDIKSSNIMLTDAGPVKVVDFGLVRGETSEEAADLTGELVLGTPEYMAPELFSGQRPDALSDVYALGVTAFEALTGQLPFGNGSFREMAQRHINKPVPKPTSVRADLPEAADAALMRALVKDSSRRYPSAERFAQAIATITGKARPERAPGARPEPEETVAEDELPTCLATVLVVEDDALARDHVVEHLRRLSYDVETAADGIEALLKLGSRRFDLIISDIAMPNLDGVTLLRMKTAKGIATPILFLTGSADGRDREIIEEMGCAGFLTKPVKMAAIAEAVQKVIQGGE